MQRTRNRAPWIVAAIAVIAACGTLIYSGLANAGNAGAHPKEEAAPQLSQQTRQDLDKAMHGEAFAFSKYMLYAEHARRTGHPDLAALFEKTAYTERFEHFAEEAELAGLVGSNEENLRDAIKGESYEVQTMYPEFASQASAAGDHAAAHRFSEIRSDEMTHRDAYKAALQKLQTQSAAVN